MILEYWGFISLRHDLAQAQLKICELYKKSIAECYAFFISIEVTDQATALFTSSAASLS